MPEIQRPNPDELLASLKKDEARLHKGRLRVFLGMCAGVGKTYAMLESGTKARWEGVDAVIGLVETHGRFETAALVDSLPIIARKKISHRGTELNEMDLDAILERKPKLVLVDELAHSNAPGSRHPKRWQDVLELLDAGIDVYTTINVQHLESRKESVEKITGISIHETVPDSIIERADQVEVMDISPAELLERLAEGKVYPGEKAKLAAANFFKPEPLTALREISLRFTAERVDKELQEYNRFNTEKGAWNTSERVMVAVSPSPFSERLVRAARRLASSLRSPWLAVYVSQGEELDEKRRDQLRKNLALAEELGAEVISTADSDLAGALRRLAASRNVSQIVLGRPAGRRFADVIEGGSLLNRLTREKGDFDVHVVRSDESNTSPWSLGRLGRFEATALQYWYTLWIMGGLAALGSVAGELLGYRAVGFFFLCGVLALGLFYSLGPVLFAAALSAMVWDYFFIPPRFTFTISTSEDALMILAYFLAASSTGLLTHRIRRNQRILEERERRSDLLYRLVSQIALGDREGTLKGVADMLEGALKRNFAVFLTDSGGKLINEGHSRQPFQLSDKELAVASWALSARKPAGWSTSNLPSSDALYMPLLGAKDAVGLLVCRPHRSAPLSVEEEELLKAAAGQLALSLERERLEERGRETDLLKESEQLHQALLNSISHELRTPLTALLGSAAALKDEATASDAVRRDALLEEVSGAGERLNRVIENLLDMARLSSGVLALKKEWQDPAELARLTASRLKSPLSRHTLKLELPEGMPLIQVDYRLIEHALSNLLLNAAVYAPQGTEITLSAQQAQSPGRSRIEFSVADRGPGIPEASLGRLFEKFYRVPGSPAGGTGLGLYITQSLMRAHGGEARARNREDGGAEFTLSLPLEAQPAAPAEAR